MTTIPVTLYLMSHYVFIDNQIHLRNKHTETMKKENRQTFRLWLTCLTLKKVDSQSQQLCFKTKAKNVIYIMTA